MKQTTLICFCFIAAINIIAVYSHGRLMEPPSRNAMWRLGFPNPVNYKDNEQYCGGFVVHYQKNGGKCGICGDNYVDKVPRDHEAGGIFSNGIIGKRYVVGQEIDITVQLTTNHKGWMELKLCANNDPQKIATQECLEENPLMVVGGSDHKFVIPQDSKKVETFKWKVKLPDSITCSQCVIQWTYYAGNTWGKCVDGSESTGCGDQETFINCADVEIYSNVAHIPDNNIGINPWALYYRGSAFPGSAGAAISAGAAGTNAITDVIESPLKEFGLKPLVITSQLCLPIKDYVDVPGMYDWCRINCLKYPPNCHEAACKCVHECRAIGEFALLPEADIFCNQNCLKHPSHCPKDRCECF